MAIIKFVSKFVGMITLIGSIQWSAQSSTFAEDSTAAPATASSDVEPAEVDLSVAINYYRQFVNPVPKEFTLFHWFSGSGRDPIWKTNFGPQHPAGVDHLKNLSSLYWQTFCGSDDSMNPIDCRGRDKDRLAYASGNMYGPGVYLSTDPVATVGYGSDANWVLEQVTLPRGFRYVDLTTAGQMASGNPPPEVQAILSQIQCDKAMGRPALNLSIDSLFHVGTSYGVNFSASLSVDTCRLGLRRIFKDNLKVGGFFYSYGAAAVPKCHNHDGAFVLIDSAQVPAANVRIYNSKSREDNANRIRIMSLFYLVGSSQSGFLTADPAKFLAYYGTPGTIPNYPTAIIQANGYFSGYCGSGNCNVTAGIVDVNDPTHVKAYVNLSAPPGYFDAAETGPPVIMSRTKIPSLMAGSSIFPRNELMWPDLEGTPVDADLEPWVQKHLHGCP